MMKLKIEQVIPHREGMQLIDKMVAINNESITCESIINETNLFYDTEIKGVYAWIGVEYIAQAISAYAGAKQYQENNSRQPSIGFLLSVRKFITTRTHFARNETLTIVANEIFLDDSVGVFNGLIQIQDQIVAEAKLSTYQPNEDKIKQILKGDVTL